MSRRRRARQRPAAARCLLDSGGLSALVGRSQRARAWLRWIVEHDGAICVPTPILVESTTGSAARDAEINRVLQRLSEAASVLRAPDERVARLAGALRHHAGVDDGIDALVAAEAAGSGAPCVLLTSDPDDLGRLLARHRQVSVERV